MIAIRTLTFVSIIMYRPENALLAFGVAQLVATIIYTAGHYVYFYKYIQKVKRPKLKRRMSLVDDGEEYVISEFPFRSLRDFLPGQLENNVCIAVNVNFPPSGK